jgi:hypothetical protein
MFRFTKASTEELLDTLDINSHRYSEIFAADNEIDAYCLHIGVEVQNLAGTIEYNMGCYLSVNDEGFPVGFTFREFEDTFLVGNPIIVESVSGKQKFASMGNAKAPGKGPDAMAIDIEEPDEEPDEEGGHGESAVNSNSSVVDADVDGEVDADGDAADGEEPPGRRPIRALADQGVDVDIDGDGKPDVNIRKPQGEKQTITKDDVGTINAADLLGD